MKLKSFNAYLSLLIILLFSNSLRAEEKIDIWKNKNKENNELQSINSEKETNRIFDISILLEPTSPLRTSNDIEICLNKLIQDNHKSIATVSIVPAHYRPQKTLTIDKKGKIGFFLPPKDEYSRRQKISLLTILETVFVTQLQEKN